MSPYLNLSVGPTMYGKPETNRRRTLGKPGEKSMQKSFALKLGTSLVMELGKHLKGTDFKELIRHLTRMKLLEVTD